MEIKNQKSRNYEKFSLREKRLVFVDGNGGERDNQANENQEEIKAWEAWESENIGKSDEEKLANYEKYLKEKLTKDASKKEEIERKLNHAKSICEGREKESEKDSFLKKLREAREYEKKEGEIAKKGFEKMSKKEIAIRKLRKFIRDEIEALGIDVETQDSKLIKEIVAFEEEIVESIKGLLRERGYESEDLVDIKNLEDYREAYDGLVDFFGNPKKVDFIKSMGKATNYLPEEVEALLGLKIYDFERFAHQTSGEKLMEIEEALKIVNRIFADWEYSEVLATRNLNKKIGDVEDEGFRLKKIIEEKIPPTQREESWDKEFVDFRNCLQVCGDLAKGNPADRKLAFVLLTHSSGSLGKLFKSLIQSQQTSDDGEEGGGGDSHDSHSHDGFHEHKHEHGNKLFKIINKGLHKTLTADGNITWYSWNDIAGAFHLIKESWEKHTYSVSEDKRGPLAEGIMFWRPEVERRIQEQDRIGEKGRADERKKHYKTFDYKRLRAELVEWPAKDKRRAILEVLAERGNLRLSDESLINSICRSTYKFSKEEWEEAHQKADYTLMRRVFKQAIENDFIGEDGYGQALLNMQASGLDSSADAGKRLAGSGESVSTKAEIGILEAQRGKSFKLGPDGEYTIHGMVETMVGRGNPFSNNGTKNQIEIIVDGKPYTMKEADSDMGLVGLMLVDSYLRGGLSREFLAGIGKKHESGFNPFSSWSDILAIKNEDLKGKKVCIFEKWGWVKEEDAGKGYITELGKTEIPKFFNTRNAKAKIIDDEGNDMGEKIVHLAIDSGTYARHSRRHTSVKDACRQKIAVGDKLVSYLVKRSNTDLFDNATQLSQGDKAGSLIGETDEIASLIKAGVEDFLDGVDLMRNERYYDSFSGKEVFDDGSGGYIFGDGEIVENIQNVRGYGKERLERGRNILKTMFENLYLYTRDREILKKNGQYRGKTLVDFIKNELPQNNISQTYYDEVIVALDRLADETKVRTPQQIAEERRKEGRR